MDHSTATVIRVREIRELDDELFLMLCVIFNADIEDIEDIDFGLVKLSDCPSVALISIITERLNKLFLDNDIDISAYDYDDIIFEF